MNDILNIDQRVMMAQQNTDLADRLIRECVPFIKKETAKLIGHIPVEGEDDELSIALMGFHEAIESFDKSKDIRFFTFASTVIKRRIIDFMRHEKRNAQTVSLDEDIIEEEKGGVQTADSDDIIEREILVWEVQQLIKELGELGITLTDVAADCPKLPRTMADCRTAVDYIISKPEHRKDLFRFAKIPVTDITRDTAVKRKTLEKHRKYLIALVIIYFRGYDSLIEHLSEVFKSRKGGK